MRIARLAILSALSTSLYLATTTHEAAAFNEYTHRHIVETAVAISADDLTLLSAPAGVDSNAWANLVRRAPLIAPRLSRLRTGVTPAIHGADVRDVMDIEASPPVDLVNDPQAINNIPWVCGYFAKSDRLSNQDPVTHQNPTPEPGGREYNLLYANRIRIMDFPYYPNMTYDGCAYSSTPSLIRTDIVGRVGAVVGFHASWPDKRTSDQVLWVRPASTILAGGVLQELYYDAFDYTAGAVLIALECLASAVSEQSFKDCNTKDGLDLARQIDPAQYIFGAIPGIGPIKDDAFGGLWHFVDVDASVNTFNSVRGMLYENAGPEFLPGVLDVLIMAATDIAGVGLNATSSAGVEAYGQYDLHQRSKPVWQAHNLGHTEFSPVSNLAHYGWEHFDGQDASWLGFPLHAIGDAAEPHHVTGTTAYGHRPFEDAVDNVRDDLMPSKLVKPVDFAAMEGRVLAIAAKALADFDSHPKVEDFVVHEARATRELSRADGGWPYNDASSFQYQFGDRTASIDSYQKATGALVRMQPYVEQAMGYTLAFLIHAAERVGDGAAFDATTLCPDGDYFTGDPINVHNDIPGCATGPDPGLQESLQLATPPGLAGTGVSCGAIGEACNTNNDCCNNTPCSGPGGTCGVATCTLVGTHCDQSSDCCGGLVCAANQCVEPSACPGPTCIVPDDPTTGCPPQFDSCSHIGCCYSSGPK